MCTTCGCGHGEALLNGRAHSHETPDFSRSRILRMEEDLLETNNGYAAANRERFAESGTLALNLVSSPGSGKTTLLVRTIEALKRDRPVAVIEGDQQTSLDADRIRAAGAMAAQINTGKACHLDAHMVGHAVEELELERGGFLFIENVGNLVCPAGFDLGEAARVVVLSVTEGDDKPLKYPDIFDNSALMLVNKCDLLPHVDFDVARCVEYARRIHADIEVIELSARTGEGFAAWFDWLHTRHAAMQTATEAIA